MAARTTPGGVVVRIDRQPPRTPSAVAGPCALRPVPHRERQSITRGDLCCRLAHLKFGPGRDTKGLATTPGPRAARRRVQVAKKQHSVLFGGCVLLVFPVFSVIPMSSVVSVFRCFQCFQCDRWFAVFHCSRCYHCLSVLTMFSVFRCFYVFVFRRLWCFQ